MAKSPDQSEPDVATRIMERMVRMPPKPHKDMKLGKRKPKGNGMVKLAEKATLQLDGVKIWGIIDRFIVPPCFQIVSRAIPTSSSPTYHSHRVSECALLDDEGGKLSLAEK
jgi:hypothetical protein